MNNWTRGYTVGIIVGFVGSNLGIIIGRLLFN
jgi:hypothetical protein